MPARRRNSTDVRRIFRQEGPPSRGLHFGCRIVQARDGNLFLTPGDHFIRRDKAQNLDNHLGKMIRIAPDGSVPKDNPFVGRAGAKPEIWSYGHRNRQGARCIPPPANCGCTSTARSGGDEINIPASRQELRLAGDRLRRQLRRRQDSRGHAARPAWSSRSGNGRRSIAPSGMAFYTGDLFPQWKGNACSSARWRTQMLVRLELDGEKVTREERMLRELNERIRDVRRAPTARYGWSPTITGAHPAADTGEIVRLPRSLAARSPKRESENVGDEDIQRSQRNA